MKTISYVVEVHTFDSLDDEISCIDLWNFGYFETLEDAKRYCERSSLVNKELGAVYTIYRSVDIETDTEFISTMKRLSSFYNGKILANYRKNDYKFLKTVTLCNYLGLTKTNHYKW